MIQAVLSGSPLCRDRVHGCESLYLSLQSHLLDSVVDQENPRDRFFAHFLLVVEAVGRSPSICITVKQRTFIF